MEANSALELLGAILSVTAVVFLWSAIYLLRNIVRTAEIVEKKGMGSGGLLLALPLGLVTPVVISYYFITEGIVSPPAGMLFIAFSSLLAAAMLILRPVLALVKLTGRGGLPKFALFAYGLAYAAANLFYVLRMPPDTGFVNLIMLAAELLLGAVFIILSAYTASFKDFRIQLEGKEFQTHYNLSFLLLFAGLLIPMDVTIMVMGVYETAIARGADLMTSLASFRFLAQLLLTLAGLMALVGMLMFRSVVEDFCFRMGSMSALVRKEQTIRKR